MADNKQIISPIPGVFYRRPSPEEEIYINEGQKVQTEDVVGLIEVMKNFTEIVSGEEGVVKKFLVEDEEVVEAGQVIAEIE